jgi:hypothetical protein
VDRLRGAPGGGQVRGSWDFIYRGWSLRFLARYDLNEMITGLCIMTDRDEYARLNDDCNNIYYYTPPFLLHPYPSLPHPTRTQKEGALVRNSLVSCPLAHLVTAFAAATTADLGINGGKAT